MHRPNTTRGLARALVTLTRSGLGRLARSPAPTPTASTAPPPAARPDVAPALWR